MEVLEHYCFDCHDDVSQKGEPEYGGTPQEGGFDGALIFENLLTGKMPPAKKEQPEAEGETGGFGLVGEAAEGS